MKAFIVDRYGKGHARLGDMPEPELRDDDVAIEVHAAGVNPLDSMIRNGEFKLLLPYRLPFVLGNEVAGVVRPGRRCRGRLQEGRFRAGRARLRRGLEQPATRRRCASRSTC